MSDQDDFGALIRELARLAVMGAEQSTALGALLVAKGIATQEELDQVMQQAGSVSEKLKHAAEQLAVRYGNRESH